MVEPINEEFPFYYLEPGIKFPITDEEVEFFKLVPPKDTTIGEHLTMAYGNVPSFDASKLIYDFWIKEKNIKKALDVNTGYGKSKKYPNGKTFCQMLDTYRPFKTTRVEKITKYNDARNEKNQQRIQEMNSALLEDRLETAAFSANYSLDRGESREPSASSEPPVDAQGPEIDSSDQESDSTSDSESDSDLEGDCVMDTAVRDLCGESFEFGAGNPQVTDSEDEFDEYNEVSYQPEGTCEWHQHDRFALRVYHKPGVRCNESPRNPPTNFKTLANFDELYQELEYFKDLDAAQSPNTPVSDKPFVRKLYQIELVSPDGKSYNNAEITALMDTFMRQFSNLYPFHKKRVSDKEQNRTGIVTIEYRCYCQIRCETSTLGKDVPANHFAVHRESQVTAHPCGGTMHARYCKRTGTFAVLYNHKQHEYTPAVVRDGHIETRLRELLENEVLVCAPTNVIVSLLQTLLPNDSEKRLKDEFYKYQEKYVFRDPNSWKSLLKSCEETNGAITAYTFYSGDRMGVAILFNEIMEKYKDIPLALHFDSTFGTNKEGAELFVANVTSDRGGVPIGFMFYIKVSKVSESMGLENNLKLKNRPLPQSPLAASINDSVEKDPKLQGTKVDNHKSKLVACFLALFTGSKLPRMHRPPHPRMHFSLVVIDKDLATILALYVIMPNVPLLICLWHVFDAIKKVALHPSDGASHLRNHGDLKLAPFDIPEAPYLGNKATLPHSPDKCGEFLGYDHSEKLCIVHNLDEYKKRIENPFDNTGRTKGKSGKKRASKKRKSSGNAPHIDDLKELVTRHARLNPQVPAVFEHLGKRDPQYAKARKYNAEKLHELIVRDMTCYLVEHKQYSFWLYMWINWYSDRFLFFWTNYWRSTLEIFTTNMVSEGGNKRIKSILGVSRSQVRVDKLLFKFKYLLLQRLNRYATIMADDYKKGTYYQTATEINPRFLRTRSERLRRFSKMKNVVRTKEAYRSDMIEFGTDCMNFVCGCYNYLKNNDQMCIHLFRCIHKDTFTEGNMREYRFGLRSRRVSPFFLTRYHMEVPECEKQKAHFWSNLIYEKDYLDFYDKEGREMAHQMKAEITPPEAVYMVQRRLVETSHVLEEFCVGQQATADERAELEGVIQFHSQILMRLTSQRIADLENYNHLIFMRESEWGDFLYGLFNYLYKKLGDNHSTIKGRRATNKHLKRMLNMSEDFLLFLVKLFVRLQGSILHFYSSRSSHSTPTKDGEIPPFESAFNKIQTLIRSKGM